MNIRIDLLEQLEAELRGLQAQPYRAGTPAEVQELLKSILKGYDPEQVGCEDRPFLKPLAPDLSRFNPREKEARRADQWRFYQGLQAGVTGADYALADTGTLILLSGTSGGRGLSLVPPVHIALLPGERILPALDDFLELFPAGDLLLAQGSAITFISGASRTADIELKLVHGAHGPKELHVITLLFPI
ncbi:MAG: lactate utilization protein [Deltaproteobacteria bacterium]|nr:lactate utilization protein [Deltaproteobacteria bacterium]